jgi:hypothetical protein
MNINQAKLRQFVFCLWVMFWLCSVVILMLGVYLRKDDSGKPTILSNDVLPAVTSLAGLWIPPLSCFVGFWFPKQERKKANVSCTPRDRATAAVALTVGYQLFVIGLVIWATFLVPYQHPAELVSPPGESFLDRIGGIVKLSLLMSPVVLTPTNWLTRSGN